MLLIHFLAPLVAVVILNHNQAAYTLDCLASLVRLDYPRYRVLVVDNGSAGDDAGRITRNFPDISVLCLPENLGVAGGRNAGLREVLQWRPEYVLFLDNDTLVAPDLLNYLVARAESDPRIGAVQPKIYFADPPNRICSVGGKYYPRISHSRHPRSGQYDSPRTMVAADIDILSGCCALVRSEVFRSVGLLDETYSPYCHEDVDFSLRLLHADYRLMVEPAAVLWHRVSCIPVQSPEKLKQLAKGHILFLRFHTSLLDLPASILWIAVHILRRYLLPALIHRQWESAAALLSGVKEGLQQERRPVEMISPSGSTQGMAGKLRLVRRFPRILVAGVLGPFDSGPTRVYETLLRSRFTKRFEVRFLDVQLVRNVADFERVRPRKLFRLLASLLHAAWCLGTLRYDAVCLPLATNRNAFLKDSVYIWLANLFHVPIVILEHGTNIPALYQKSGRAVRALMRATLRKANRCVVLAACLKFNFEAFVPRERIDAVYLGIDPVRNGSGQRRRSPEKLTMLYLSTLLLAKGIMVLLNALPAVLAARSDVECVIAGGWGSDAGTVRNEVERFLCKSLFREHVSLIGPVQGPDKLSALEQADIFIMPTLADTAPLVLLEALRAGLPIVATRVGAIPEIVADGVNGLICEPGNPAELAEKILYLADHAELRQRMRQNNRQRFQDYFTTEQFAERMIRVFESVLAEAAPAATSSTPKGLLGAAAG